MKTLPITYGATITSTAKNWIIRSVAVRYVVNKNDDARIVLTTTGQQLLLSEILAGKNFSTFDPIEIFGTENPTGQVVRDWLAKNDDISHGMEWVRNTVPLDILLGYAHPRPGVTSDPSTGWHWSCRMHAVTGVKLNP